MAIRLPQPVWVRWRNRINFALRLCGVSVFKRNTLANRVMALAFAAPSYADWKEAQEAQEAQEKP